MDDAAIMARIVAGDATAVENLYDRYGRQVYSLALRLLQDPAAAEDAVQESFVKVWKKAAQFDPERGRLVTWILHLTYTTAVDLLRARRRAGPTRSEAEPPPPDLDADTAAAAETAVLGAQVREAMLRLPPEQRQALELAYFGALSHQEISTQMGIPLGTVKGRVRLGLEALRQLLMVPRRKGVDRRVKL